MYIIARLFQVFFLNETYGSIPFFSYITLQPTRISDKKRKSAQQHFLKSLAHSKSNTISVAPCFNDPKSYFFTLF